MQRPVTETTQWPLSKLLNMSATRGKIPFFMRLLFPCLDYKMGQVDIFCCCFFCVCITKWGWLIFCVNWCFWIGFRYVANYTLWHHQAVKLYITVLFLLFAFCGGDDGQLSLRCMATFNCYIFPLLPVVCLLSLLFNSSFVSALLFTQSSHLSPGLLRFLQPPCFFVSETFSIISCLSFLPRVQPILPTICQALT